MYLFAGQLITAFNQLTCGDLSMDAKRRIQPRLVEFVKRRAQDEAEQRVTVWQHTPATVQ